MTLNPISILNSKHSQQLKALIYQSSVEKKPPHSTDTRGQSAFILPLDKLISTLNMILYLTPGHSQTRFQEEWRGISITVLQSTFSIFQTAT